MVTFEDIPPQDPAENMLPIKTFVFEYRWYATAIINALSDSGEIRDAVWLTCINSGLEGAKIPGDRIVGMVERGLILQPYEGWVARMGGPPFSAALIDIVTYPFYFALIHDVDLRKDPKALFKININLIAPYVDHFGEAASILSLQHSNEDPIDDAPTHNLIVHEVAALSAVLQRQAHISPEEAEFVARQEIWRELRAFIEKAPNPIGVYGDDPVMDDRYVYMERRAVDGPPKRLPDI